MDEQIKAELAAGGIDMEGILERLQGMDRLVKKFLLKFPDEKCYQELVSAMEAKDYQAAFAHAHNLKGVAANLEMHPLVEQVGVLVEKLRFAKPEELEEAELQADMEKIDASYQKVSETIRRVLGEQEQ